MSGDTSNDETDINHAKVHSWIFEPPTAKNDTMTLTEAGVEMIANHKYKSGHYTFLDNLLQPFWNALTELLPMWLAPNMVTFIGAMHCGVSYFISWYHSPSFDKPVPDWVVFLSGYCSIAYYTFDCMDGKQARRTGQSSPLGQLFDHGFDCICNLSHISTIAGYLAIGGSYWFLGLQASLFYAFFQAQWEEYYTGSLPHAMGNFGVTEANYFLGAFAIFNSFIDREKFWTRLMVEVFPEAVSSNLPSYILDMELRHFGLTVWMITSVVLILNSFYSVMTHEFVTTHNLRFSALSKLLTPFLVVAAPCWLPNHIIVNETRSISVCLGLLCCLLTIKMICFSMAKQSFASIQMEAFPYFAVIILINCDYSNNMLINDQIATLLLGSLSVWYAYRLVKWGKNAIAQITERLDIYCFSIKHPKTKAA